MTIYEKEELTNYHILSNIHEDENVSQRKLSSQIGVNVASVNFALKRLITKGFVKMIGVNARRIKYIITPTGIKEKSELAYKFFDRNFHFYKDVRIDIEARIHEVSNGENMKVAISGVNKLSELTFLAIQNMELELIGVFSVKPCKNDEKFLGQKVFGLESIEKIKPNIVLLTESEESDIVAEAAEKAGVNVIDLTGYYKV